MNAEYTGKQIAEFRKQKGFTQKDLASKLHVTDKAVSKIFSYNKEINCKKRGFVGDG